MKTVLLSFCLFFSAIGLASDKQMLLLAGDLYPRVKMETNLGTIVVELDRLKAPYTVHNFMKYIEKKDYDNTVFHRVIDGFVAQGGGFDTDFIPKNTLDPVINESGNGLKNDYGTIAMARQSDPHSATRQFFFNLGDNTSLNPGINWGYTVFGAVVEGEEVLQKMAQVKTEFKPAQNWQDAPVESIVLIKATVLPSQ